MRSRLRKVFSTLCEFYAKNVFLKSHFKRLFYGIIKYNLFSYVYIIPVSLSRPSIYIYMVSIFS